MVPIELKPDVVLRRAIAEGKVRNPRGASLQRRAGRFASLALRFAWLPSHPSSNGVDRAGWERKKKDAPLAVLQRSVDNQKPLSGAAVGPPWVLFPQAQGRRDKRPSLAIARSPSLLNETAWVTRCGRCRLLPRAPTLGVPWRHPQGKSGPRHLAVTQRRPPGHALVLDKLVRTECPHSNKHEQDRDSPHRDWQKRAALADGTPLGVTQWKELGQSRILRSGFFFTKERATLVFLFPKSDRETMVPTEMRDLLATVEIRISSHGSSEIRPKPRGIHVVL